jgi:hypothetical protein
MALEPVTTHCRGRDAALGRKTGSASAGLLVQASLAVSQPHREGLGKQGNGYRTNRAPTGDQRAPFSHQARSPPPERGSGKSGERKVLPPRHQRNSVRGWGGFSCVFAAACGWPHAKESPGLLVSLAQQCDDGRPTYSCKHRGGAPMT